MSTLPDIKASPFMTAFYGSLRSALRWPELDVLWQALRAHADAGWYVYAIGEEVPQTPVAAGAVCAFIDGIDILLRKEHKEDYCGIVYADDFTAPTLIKIYDPNNLGVTCGCSNNPPLPGWVLSLHPPVDLPSVRQAAARQRWWQRIFAPTC